MSTPGTSAPEGATKPPKRSKPSPKRKMTRANSPHTALQAGPHSRGRGDTRTAQPCSMIASPASRRPPHGRGACDDLAAAAVSARDGEGAGAAARAKSEAGQPAAQQGSGGGRPRSAAPSHGPSAAEAARGEGASEGDRAAAQAAQGSNDSEPSHGEARATGYAHSGAAAALGLLGEGPGAAGAVAGALPASPADAVKAEALFILQNGGISDSNARAALDATAADQSRAQALAATSAAGAQNPIVLDGNDHALQCAPVDSHSHRRRLHLLVDLVLCGSIRTCGPQPRGRLLQCSGHGRPPVRPHAHGPEPDALSLCAGGRRPRRCGW
jgi:hypothetical protein